jgi:hypothetical protein
MIFILLAMSFILLALLRVNITIFYYVIIFVSYAITTILLIIVYNYFSGVISLVFIMVYIGAIIVIVAYVCSVLPNEKAYSYPVSAFFSIFILSIFFFSPRLTRFSENTCSSSSLFSLASFFYETNVLILFLLLFLLLILLLIATNSFHLKSTLRSI